MPGLVEVEDGPVAKRQKISAPAPASTAKQQTKGSRIFAPYRTVGLVSPTSVPFTSIPLGKTTFQITTSTGRSLHTYDLRRGLNLVFISRPQTPAQITATYAWKDVVLATWGASSAGPGQGLWVFKRGRKINEVDIPTSEEALRNAGQHLSMDHSINKLHVFGPWLVACTTSVIHIFKVTDIENIEHYTTLHTTSASFSGPVCSIPTFLNKLLVGKSDGSIELWNTRTGKLIYTISPPSLSAGPVTALEPSPALGLVAIARARAGVVIHDIRRDMAVLKLRTTDRVTSLSFRTDGLGAGPDGRQDGLLATSSHESGDVTLWDLNNAGRVAGILRGAHDPPSASNSSSGGGISGLEFLPGQAVLVTSGRDNALRTWIFDRNAATPAVPQILHSRSGHAGAITGLHFLPTDADGADAIGKWLMSSGRDRSLWSWSLRRDGQSTELSQGGVKRKAKKLGFDGKKVDRGEKGETLEDLKAPEITCLASNMNRDGGMGASAGGGPVWANVARGNSKRAGTDPNAPVTGWESVVTGHRGDKFARTWFWGRKKAGRWAFETGDGTEVRSVAMSPCGTFALVGSAGGAIDMFNLQSGIHRKRFPAPLTPAQARQLKLKQAQLAEGNMQEVDVQDNHFGPGRGRHTRDVTGIVVDSLNRTVISCGLDGKIKFWDFRSGTLRHEVDWHPMASITNCRYHRASDLLALSCDDLSIRVVDIETRKTVRELWGCVGQVKDFCFSNDGRWIIAASMDSVVRVWDLPTGHLIDAIRLDSVCTALAFSPTGEFLATAHADSIGVSVWSNRALFKHIPVRRLQEEDIAPAISLPSDSAEGTQPLLAAAFEDDEEDEEPEDITANGTILDQLSGSMATLSLVPRSRWQTLLHLDLIAARNKPIEPPKAPEKAPFFLPALDKAKNDPTSTPAEADAAANAALAVSAGERSRISALQKRGGGVGLRQFTKLLHAAAKHGEFEPFIAYMKTLAPAAADIEIRSLRAAVNEDEQPLVDELAAFVAALTARLKQRRDYEVLQAWMAVFLRIHGEIVLSGASPGCMRELQYWKEVQRSERERLGALIGYCGGVVQFLRSVR